MKHLAILELQVPLEVVDSCTFSAADLVGGWVNQVKVNSYGVGTWDNGNRPTVTVKPSDMCGAFDVGFPDDRVYRGFLSSDKNLLTYSRDNKWPRTSSDTPSCSIQFLNKPGSGNYANCDGVYIIDTSKLLNGQPVYVNAAKNRFLGYTGGNWVITGTQWLDGILKNQGSFGGFHGNSGKDVSAGWNEYTIRTNCPLPQP